MGQRACGVCLDIEHATIPFEKDESVKGLLARSDSVLTLNKNEFKVYILGGGCYERIKEELVMSVFGIKYPKCILIVRGKQYDPEHGSGLPALEDAVRYVENYLNPKRIKKVKKEKDLVE